MANLKVTLNPKVTKKEVNGKTVNQIKISKLGASGPGAPFLFHGKSNSLINARITRASAVMLQPGGNENRKSYSPLRLDPCRGFLIP